MDYDDLLANYLGEFGLYQGLIFVLIALVTTAANFTNLSIVFIAAIPKHWCYVPELEDLTKADSLNISIPLETTEDGTEVYSSCEMFKGDYDNVSFYDVSDFNNNDHTIYCKHGWEYDKSIYKSTIVTQWDLVCDDLWLRSTTVSVYMAGYMIGVVVSGTLSDAFGRKKIFIGSILGMASLSISLAFSTSYAMFLTLRFFVAAFAVSGFTCGFVIIVEMTGPKSRMHTGVIISYFWALGSLIIAGISFLIRDWRRLQLALSVPIVGLLILFWIVPESPRWLYMKRRHEEADEIVRKIAKINMKVLPDDLTITARKSSKAFLWDLFRIKKLRKRTIIVAFNWYVASLVYYGLSLNTASLSGNPYFNFFISGAVEIPAYVFVQLNPLCCGRRIPLSGTMLLAGTALLSTLIPYDVDWLTVVLSMIGKFAISASFSIVYVFTAELYPTQVRNVAVGTVSFFARIGGIIAPYIAQLANVSSLIPVIVFGASALLAGALALLLPETKDKHLPQTLQELQEEREDTNEEKPVTNGKNDVAGFTNIAYISN